MAYFHGHMHPGSRKNDFSVKIIVFVRGYNQQFQGTILLMVFDFLGVVFFQQKTKPDMDGYMAKHAKPYYK